MRMKGKTALIAGASRNIGREIALTFAREGADVMVFARQHEDEVDESSFVTGDRIICAGGRYM